MEYYEGLVIPSKDSSSPKAATRVMELHTRIFCIRANRGECANISCERCLFDNNNTTKFNKWYSEMKEAFEARKTATIH